MTRFVRPLAITTAVFAFALVALSPLVRITGSGLGCGDHWPLCNGQIIPTFHDLTVAIEWGHRVAALGFGLLLVTLLIAARGHRAVFVPAAIALVLVIPQGLLGRLAVKTELQYGVVVIHWSAALALLALVILAALRTGETPAPRTSARAFRTVRTAFIGGALVLVLGGLTANLNAGFACGGFPLCQGRLWPNDAVGGLAHIQWVHRLVAYLLTLHIVSLPLVFRRRNEPSSVQRAAWSLAGVLTVHIVVAAWMVEASLPLWARTTHAILGTAVWAGLVYLSWLVRPAKPTTA
ncbi:MAG: COX15/CtaA family protein [Gemmatimonadales bacterium]